MFFNSLVSPELLIKIKISFLEILPKSPWEASLADKIKEALPTDEKVELNFALILEDFPTPQNIIFD